MKPDLLRDIGQGLDGVSAALGKGGFERRLADFLGRLVAHDMMTLTRYSSIAPPEFLAHTANYPSDLVERYLELYHLFDPFADHWRSTGRPGPVSLADLPPGQRKVSRYIRELLPRFGIADEMGIFLPPLAGTSLAVFFESVGRKFPKSQRERLAALYPLAANLYRAHLAVLFSTPAETDAGPSPIAQPMLITDEAGNTLWSTPAWTRLPAATRTRAESLAAHGPENAPRTRPLDEAHAVISEPLPAGGRGARQWLWAVESRDRRAGPGDPTAAGMRVFDETLTPREREIVGLILKGHPTVSIAARLGLSRGTVKNHRRRIYERLDITTERELFLMFIDAALGRTDPAEKA